MAMSQHVAADSSEYQILDTHTPVSQLPATPEHAFDMQTGKQYLIKNGLPDFNSTHPNVGSGIPSMRRITPFGTKHVWERKHP